MEIETEFNEAVQGNPDTCKIIFEDFRSQIVIDSAQFFMQNLQNQVQQKDLVIKRATSEKDDFSHKQAVEAKTLEK